MVFAAEDGGEVLIPLHREIVIDVDEAARTLCIDPPPGLLGDSELAAGLVEAAAPPMALALTSYQQMIEPSDRFTRGFVLALP